MLLSTALATELNATSINSNDQLELDLSEQSLNDQEFTLILDTLNCLQNGIKLNLYLVYNAIKKAGALALA